MKKRLYVELDGLLDTRLGTLIRLDEPQAQVALAGGYFTRESDDWSKLGLSVDQAAYDDLYRHRDETTLKMSRCSDLVPMVHRMTHELESMGAKTPFVSEITLDVNFWPYQLSDEIRQEILSAVRIMVSPSVKVESVWFAPAQLNPELIDRSWDGVLMYDFNTWLTEHQERLKDKQIPRIPFIVPALYWNGIPTPEETEIEDVGQIDPFAALEMLLAEYVMLHMVEPKFFSLIDLKAT